MNYIYNQRKIRVEWSIYKGSSGELEDFSRAYLKVFIIGPNSRYAVEASVSDMSPNVTIDMPQGLPEGVYLLEAIWGKNWMLDDEKFNPTNRPLQSRDLSHAKTPAVFALTSDPAEENIYTSTGTAVVKVRSNVATYGYDGLDAYQIAIIRGRFWGSEQEWLDSLGDRELINYYTKGEVDEKLENVSVDLSDYYTKDETDTKIDEAAGGLRDDVEANTDDITAAKNDIHDIDERVSDNTTAIGQNTENITSLQGGMTSMGDRVSTLETRVDNFVGLNQSNYKGMFSDVNSLPSMTELGWAWVGDNMTSMAVYVWFNATDGWTRYGSYSYDLTDYSGVASQLATIGLKIGDLEDLDTTANEDLVSAINEVNEKAGQGGSASLPDTEEDGFFVVDSSHYVGAKYDGNGLDAAKISKHFKEIIQGDVRQEVMNLKQPAVSGDTANIVSIGLITDIHGDAYNLEDFVKICDEFSIDYKLHLGDATIEYNYGKVQSYSFWTSVEGNDEIMNIVGNHDSRRSGSWTGVPQTEVYDCIINPFASTISVVQPTGASANGLCYYYKDLNTHVRLICLDCMFWNQAEYDWLSTVLDDAKTNSMHVIIACHYPTNAITLADSSWNCRLKGAKITDTSIGGQPSYLDKYTPTMASDLVQSFIDGGGKFIAWICGHNHRNWLGHLTAHPTQLQFCMPSSRYNYSTPTYFGELGNINQHCFTIIGIDTYNGYLKAVRIGKRNDSFMQKQQQFCYDYLNNELIYTA